MASTMYDIPQLIDMALGLTDTGAVNFNILHAVLQALVQLMDINNVRVELVGLPIGNVDEEKGREINVQEYEYEYSTNARSIIYKTPKIIDKLLVVGKFQPTISDMPILKSPVSPVRSPKQQQSVPEIKQSQPIVQPVRSVSAPPTPSPQFQEERKIPSQLSTTAQDPRIAKDLGGRIKNIENKLIIVETSLDSLKRQGEKLLEKSAAESSSKSGAENTFKMRLTEDVNKLRKIIDNITLEMRNFKDEQGKQSELIRNLIKQDEDEDENKVTCSEVSDTLNTKIDALSTRIMRVNELGIKNERDIRNLISDINEVNEKIKKETSAIKPADLLKDINGLRLTIDLISANTNQVMSDRDTVRSELDGLQIGFEDLQRRKLDKDELEELLAEKADYSLLNRKVSIDKFEANKRDWDNALVNIMTKLAERDESITKSVGYIEEILKNKPDKVDIEILKENLKNTFMVSVIWQ